MRGVARAQLRTTPHQAECQRAAGDEPGDASHHGCIAAAVANATHCLPISVDIRSIDSNHASPFSSNMRRNSSRSTCEGNGPLCSMRCVRCATTCGAAQPISSQRVPSDTHGQAPASERADARTRARRRFVVFVAGTGRLARLVGSHRDTFSRRPRCAIIPSGMRVAARIATV